MIKVLDDFVPLKIQNKYIELLDSEEIAWFFMKDLVVKENNIDFKNKNITDTFAMVHTLFDSKGINSNFYSLFSSILNFFCLMILTAIVFFLKTLCLIIYY